jgi:hypothetical protein
MSLDDLENCYRVLGLESGASPEEVRQAYRDLVTVRHPDRFTQDPRLRQKAQDKLKEITDAYRRLQSSGGGSREQSFRPTSRGNEAPGDDEPAGGRPRGTEAPRVSPKGEEPSSLFFEKLEEWGRQKVQELLADTGRLVILGTLALMILACFFPPWRQEYQGVILGRGFFAFILNPPDRMFSTVDLAFLAFELVVIGLVGAFIWILLGKTRS